MKKISLKKFFKMWFGALIIALLLAIPLVIGYFASADSADQKGFYHTYLKPILEYKMPVILTLVIIFLFLAITEYFKEQMKEELEKEYTSKKGQLEEGFTSQKVEMKDEIASQKEEIESLNFKMKDLEALTKDRSLDVLTT